jgi:hypothetical protein
MADGGLWVVRNGDDPVASDRAVGRALDVLAGTLERSGMAVRRCEDVREVPSGGRCVLVGGPRAQPARALLDAAGIALPDAPETLALVPGESNGRSALLACARDGRGAAYALRELADRVAHAEDAAALSLSHPIVERPAVAIRSIARLFTSDVEDTGWFHDRDFWRAYLSMLVSNRWNRFSLTLGLGYNFPRHVRDAYFYFAYPFLLDVPGYSVRVAGLSDSERDKNLESLRFIGEEATAVGLHFQLALWTHAYECQDSPDVNYTITGLTPESHAPYCRDALRTLLEACPAIAGLTFRIHGESGIPERSYDFWRTLFDGIAQCGRVVEIDMHAKGMDWEMIEVALATGMPVNVSPKYWAEHMGLPYHQASIRALERPPRDDRSEGFMALSGGSRRFLRYGYGDLLREDRQFGVLHRIWPGTQRLLLWSDPATAAGYGRLAGFCGSAGMELCEPLSFKGRMGSGLPGSKTGYADATLEPPDGDWTKYLPTYRVLGRLLYNPDADPETWRRAFRREYGRAASDVESALAHASRILPLVTVAHHPSASNNAYWPEVYTDIPIVSAERRHPYGDTPSPRLFGTVSPLDPELFSGVDEFAEEIVAGRVSGRISPIEVAQRLDRLADAAENGLRGAHDGEQPAAPALRRAYVDAAIQAGIGRFFAAKLRAAVRYSLHERTGDTVLLEEAVAEYERARNAWAALAAVADGVYVDDITYGLSPHLRGHWKDRLGAIEADLNDMRAKRTAAGGPLSGDAARRARAARDFLALVSDTPPRWTCEHAPPASYQLGEPLAVSATVRPTTHSTGRPSIFLHYRHTNQAETWRTVAMRADGDGFRADIPSDYTDSPYPLQYFIEVREGDGLAWLCPGLGEDLANQPYYVVGSE